MSTVEYWRSPAGLHHITPGRDEWPEGEPFAGWLADTLPGTVLEFGCGTGRLARGFPVDRYIGVDVSAHAVAIARAHSGHDLREIGEDDALPAADAAFAHTVLLHVDDDAIAHVAARLSAAAPVVLVSEIMGRGWRRSGKPPVFNREAGDYVEIFDTAGMTLRVATELPYNRYGGVTFTALEFHRVSP